MSLMTKSGEEQQSKGRAALGGSFYLLDRDFAVISAQTGEENAEIGASFFDIFSANRISREEIVAYANSYPQDLLLTLCARIPVLFVGTLLAQTGLALAVVPEGEVKRTLANPAAFHHVPAHVCVSASAQMHYKPHDEETFSDACRWLTRAGAPFLYAQATERGLVSALSHNAERLAVLTDRAFSCDLSGLPNLSCENVNLEFATGVMLASLLAAPEKGAQVRLQAAMESGPVLYLELERTAIAADVPEFSTLLAVAAARGAVLDVVIPKDRPSLLQIRACIGVVELSAQGVRERNRFLEGKSPLSSLSQSYTITPSFPDLSFD